MQRRSFLAGILAAAAAPAFVRKDSLMGLWVPKEPKIIGWVGFGQRTNVVAWQSTQGAKLCIYTGPRPDLGAAMIGEPCAEFHLPSNWQEIPVLSHLKLA